MTPACQKKITVVTVVKNAAHLLEPTIQSVIAQPQSPDYIIIDGASSDGTVGIVRKYEDHLTGWVSEPDNGVYDAMNKGWAMADPESYVIFLGAGDRLNSFPEVQTTDQDFSTVLYGNVLLDNDQQFYAKSGLKLKLYNTLHHQAMMVPKKLHFGPPFDLSFPHYADFDFNQRLQKSGVSFHFCKGFSAYAAPDGLTEDLHLEELLLIVRKNYGPFWAWLSRFGFGLAGRSRLIRKLRPIG